MNRKIYLLQPQGLVEMGERGFESEDKLQALLALHPQLLAGDQFDDAEPRQWLLVGREAAIPSDASGRGRWFADHLFVDQDAVVTFVEVKRSSDTRIRREVVGQMLDYAANAVAYAQAEHLQRGFEEECRIRSSDPEKTLEVFLKGRSGAVEFWQNVKTNLEAGKIRLVFVADEIPHELRLVVEFLNKQMDPAEVLAVEVKRYTGEGLETIVPALVGRTAEAQLRKTGLVPPRTWDEPAFFDALATRCGTAEADAAKQILAWSKAHSTYVWWGRGARWGSFVPCVTHNGVEHLPFAVWTYGTVEIYFQWYIGKPAFDSAERRMELSRRLNEIPGVSIPEDAITRRPGIPLSALAADGNVSRFLSVFEWFLEEVRKT